MNHAIKLCLIIFFLWPLTGLHAQKQCVIEGNLGAVSKYVSKVFLQYAEMVSFARHTDSAEVKNGRYSFTIPFEEPGAAFILVRLNKTALATEGFPMPDEDSRVLQLFLDEGTISVISNSFPLGNSVVKGSVTGEQVKQFNESVAPLNDQLRSLQTQLKTALQNDEEQKTGSIQLQLNEMYKKIFESYRKIINAPGNRIGAYILFQVKQTARNAPAETAAAFYDHLDPAIKKTSYGMEFKKIIDFAEGIDAPGFTRISNLGDTIQLAGFRGKYVLIDFWGSWCKPCREENPFMVSLYQKYKSHSLEFIGIAKDGDDEAGKKIWLDAIQQDGLPWINVLYKGYDIMPLDAVYHVSSYPSNFLVDPKGKIIAKNIRGVVLEKKLAELLGTK
jgi:thiol-disulfide isomerase/thioredoxin